MVKLQGSVPPISADMRSLGPAPADERFDVTVLVRRRASLSADLLASHAQAGGRAYLTRAEFAARHGASDADLDAVAAFAQRSGLVVVERRPAARSIVLSGTAGQVAAAFATAIERVEHSAGISRRRTAPVHVPPELDGIVEGVFGIEDTPIARPHFRPRRPPRDGSSGEATAPSPPRPSGRPSRSLRGQRSADRAAFTTWVIAPLANPANASSSSSPWCVAPATV